MRKSRIIIDLLLLTGIICILTGIMILRINANSQNNQATGYNTNNTTKNNIVVNKFSTNSNDDNDLQPKPAGSVLLNYLSWEAVYSTSTEPTSHFHCMVVLRF